MIPHERYARALAAYRARHPLKRVGMPPARMEDQVTVAWICLDGAGDIDCAYLVHVTEPEDIREWKRAGRNPQLIDFHGARIVFGKPIPQAARILEF